MKIKVSLDEATKADAAGMAIECYLVVDGRHVQEDPTPKKRTRSMVTNDSTTYEFDGKNVPSLMPGSDLAKASEILLNMFKGNTKTRTRVEITAQFRTQRKWRKQHSISVIANLRKRDILKVKEL